MEHYTGSQYDDDLTVGLDDLDNESIDTDYVDLFEYEGDEESPITRLKTIMLSIEWEITDEVLINFNDELVQAREAWSDDRVKLVYVQALQIISKYIYQKKSDAHHNAMKVLLAFFYDLEKLALDTEISEQEKKQILADDIRKFERFKQQIGLAPSPGAAPKALAGESIGGEIKGLDKSSVDTSELYRLKASILSIDWEITDRELADISREIATLQNLYASSKPRMILLKGLDALGGYIKLKKSESHAGSFRLLNSFYDALDLVVRGRLSPEEERTLLLAEASKFNQFKQEIAESITPEAIAGQREREPARGSVSDSSAEPTAGPVPGGAEQAVGTVSAAVDTELLAGDFSEETLEKVSSFFDDFEEDEPIPLASLAAEEALRGVEVETDADDDSDEEALPTLEDGKLAPALAELDEEEEEPALGPIAASALARGEDVESEVETDADDYSDEEALPTLVDGELAPALTGLDEEEEDPAPGPIAASALVQGVDVESEADDEYDEEPVSTIAGDITPALFSTDEGEVADALGSGTEPLEGSADIDKHVEDFFGEAGLDFIEESEEAGEGPAEISTQTDTELSPALSEVGEEALDLFDSEITAEAETGEESFGDEVADRIDSFFDEDLEKPVLGTEIPEAEDLAGLRASIESFNTEANDSTIEVMQAEIDSLKNRWQNRPLEKTLLQLLATASKHVGKGYGSDDETVALMRSICVILDQVSSQKVDQTIAQELLFSETSKILDWQKNLIDRQVSGRQSN